MKTIEDIKSQLEEIKKEHEQKVQLIEKEIELLQNNEETATFDIVAKYCLNSDFLIDAIREFVLDFSSMDNFNVFESFREAQQMSIRLNAYLRLYHIAKKLNDGWEPKWVGKGSYNYSIRREWTKGADEYTYVYNVWSSTVNQKSEVYFKSRELAEQAIKLMGDESLRNYFC